MVAKIFIPKNEKEGIRFYSGSQWRSVLLNTSWCLLSLCILKIPKRVLWQAVKTRILTMVNPLYMGNP